MSSGQATEPQADQAPHPGAQSMPQWAYSAMVELNVARWRSW